MKPTVLIIPGFGESINDAPYLSLRSKLNGDFPITRFEPTWGYHTASSWTNELKKKLATIDTKNTIVVSFSFGAYITLLVSSEYKFQKIILCSLSPFFKEQMHNMPKSAQVFFGKKRVADFNTHLLPKSIKCPAIFLFGSDDWPFGISEAKKLAKKYGGVFEIIRDAHHELTDQYLAKIVSYVKTS